MREQIAAVAQEHHRSMNSEIIARLKKSLADGEEVETPTEFEMEGAWNPAIGMLVKYDGKHHAIQNFDVNDKGELLLELSGKGKNKPIVKPSECAPVMIVAGK
jgi:hypothetical protein